MDERNAATGGSKTAPLSCFLALQRKASVYPRMIEKLLDELFESLIAKMLITAALDLGMHW